MRILIFGHKILAPKSLLKRDFFPYCSAIEYVSSLLFAREKGSSYLCTVPLIQLFFWKNNNRFIIMRKNLSRFFFKIIQYDHNFSCGVRLRNCSASAKRWGGKKKNFFMICTTSAPTMRQLPNCHRKRHAWPFGSVLQCTKKRTAWRFQGREMHANQPWLIPWSRLWGTNTFGVTLEMDQTRSTAWNAAASWDGGMNTELQSRKLLDWAKIG